jgi:hypothetical protein
MPYVIQQLEEENYPLKTLVADLTLDNTAVCQCYHFPAYP